MTQQSEFEGSMNSNFKKIFNKEQSMTTKDEVKPNDDVAKQNQVARDAARADWDAEQKKPQSVADEIAKRPKFAATARSYIDKLIKVVSPLDNNGQPTPKEIADALVVLAKNLRNAQKDGWKQGDDSHNEATKLNLNDPKPAFSHARPLLVGLANRLAGLYVLSESFESARAQALTPLIEEVSQALVSVAGSMDEKDEAKYKPVFEKAGITEQKAADRLT